MVSALDGAGFDGGGGGAACEQAQPDGCFCTLAQRSKHRRHSTARYPLARNYTVANLRIALAV
jgi:hypothetical protein